MVLRVVIVVLVLLLTATATQAQNSLVAFLPPPEVLGVGWEITEDFTPSAEERAERFPWAAEFAYRRYAGPRSWRVAVIVARPKPGIAAAADAVEFVEAWVDNVYSDTEQPEGLRSRSALAALPAPAGCDAVSRAEGTDEFFGIITSATSCVTDSDLVVYAIVSGSVGNTNLPDPADPSGSLSGAEVDPSAGSLIGAEASDWVVSAVISGGAVQGMDFATPLATPAP